MSGFDLAAWLSSIGCTEYFGAFEQHRIRFQELAELTDAELENTLGVKALGDRKRLLRAIRELTVRDTPTPHAAPVATLDAAPSHAPASLPSPAPSSAPAPHQTPAALSASVSPQPPAIFSATAGPSPAELPTHLAVPLASYLTEPHPRVRLQWLIDASEAAIRWAVTLLVAELLHAHGGTLPPNIAAAIADHIERPTLGRWLLILRTLITALDRPLLLEHPKELLGAVADEYFQTRGTVETSLLLLRNRIAHGGGLTSKGAQLLIEHQANNFSQIIEKISHLTSKIELWSFARGRWFFLRGPNPQPETKPPPWAPPNPETDELWLAGANGFISLRPLATFDVVRAIDATGALIPRSNTEHAQLYERASERSLSYTPLGSDEGQSETTVDVDRFRRIFRLQETQQTDSERAPPKPPTWRDFLSEARVLAEDFLGRREEVETIKTWLKQRDPWKTGERRVGWIGAGPGIGKSMLMGKIATQYSGSKHRGLYYHRFRDGDARNNRRTFLQFLYHALVDWPPIAALHEAPAADISNTSALQIDILRLLQRHADAAGLRPTFWILVDGLDEVLLHDPGFLTVIRQLAVKGTIWLVAGRADPALDPFLKDCDPIFGSAGVPAMRPEDIRALLIEGIGQLRRALLRRDTDSGSGDGIDNPFVDAVVRRAHGLPLYVRLLIEDLRRNELTVFDEQKLPDGLAEYYDALIDRIGLSDLKRNLALLACVLAVSEEPIDAESLAILIAPNVEAALRNTALYREHAEKLLTAGQMFLRRVHVGGKTGGYTLYHQTFRDHLRRAPGLQLTLAFARELLVTIADQWSQLPPGSLSTHLFRRGTTYAVEWLGARGVEAAAKRLTDLNYLEKRCRALAAHELTALPREFELLARHGAPVTPDFETWQEFFKAHTHILVRGTEHWPANRILIQLATEHLAPAAEPFIRAGGATWPRLERIGHQTTPTKSRPWVGVLEGHTAWVACAIRLRDGRILSWSSDSTLRVWSATRDTCDTPLFGHRAYVEGAKQLEDGKIVSWSGDGTIRVWDPDSTEALAVFTRHRGPVLGVLEAPSKQLISFSTDGTVRAWSRENPALTEPPLAEHKTPVIAVFTAGDQLISCGAGGSIDVSGTKIQNGASISCATAIDGEILACGSLEGTVTLWDIRQSTPACKKIFKAHRGIVRGLLALDARHLISWGTDGEIKLYDLQQGELVKKMRARSGAIAGLEKLSTGLLITWTDDCCLRLWDLAQGICTAVLRGHDQPIYRLTELEDGRIISCGTDGTARAWSPTGKPLSVLRGHPNGVVNGALELDEHLLTWGDDLTLKLWRKRELAGPLSRRDRRAARKKRTGPGVWDPRRWWRAIVLDSNYVVTLLYRRRAAIWDATTGQKLRSFRAHQTRTGGALALGPDRCLTWGHRGDPTLAIWEIPSANLVARLCGHRSRILGVLRAPRDRLISWSADSTLRIWSSKTGAPLGKLSGHRGAVLGATLAESELLISWSLDGTARYWRLDSDDRGELHRHDRAVLGAARTPGGVWVTWSNDGTIIAGGARWTAHTGPVRGAQVLDEDTLVSWGDDGTVRRWSISTRRQLAAAGPIPFPIGGVHVSGESRADAIAWCRDETIPVWDGSTNERLANLSRHNTDSLRLPDGRLLRCDWNECFTLWEASTGRRLARRLFRSAETEALIVTPHNSLILAHEAVRWERFYLLDLQTGTVLEELDERTATERRPDLLRRRALAERPPHPDPRIAWHYQTAIGVSDPDQSERPLAVWHGERPAKMLAFDPRGLLVASIDEDLAFCRLILP